MNATTAVHAPFKPTTAGQRRIQRACACGSCGKCRKKRLQRDVDGGNAPLSASLIDARRSIPDTTRLPTQRCDQ